MNPRSLYRYGWTLVVLMVLWISAGCGNLPFPTAAATEAAPSPAPSAEPVASPSPESAATSPPQVPVSGSKALYHDDFTNPATGWTEDKFDNYFIGYHEPEYYHIEITSPHNKSTVFEPEKRSFGDATIELQVLTNSTKTAAAGDFRYGVAFRRSGDQYYAFTISPRTKTWYVLKSSPSGLEVLSEGTDEDIHELDTDDGLRVDAQGADFFFHINDQFVGQVSDAEYADGEVGLYVESFDAPNIHIHFDDLTVRDVEVAQPEEGGVALLFQDDFTNPATAWPERQFDNYFIGYHEPEYYHVEVTSPNYKTSVFEPQKRSFDHFTAELDVLVAAAKTAAEGDFRYGLAFRRTGDQYYAFTISPRARKWYVLKSSPNALEVLAEGTDETLHEADVDDTLRVDAQGPNFLFHINDQLVGQVSDPDYATGEVGFYVESFDSPNTHIHFDTLAIRDVDLPLKCSVVNNGTLYVRSGPGKAYSQIAVLADGDNIQALGITANQDWIKIKVEGSEAPGWVGLTEGYLSCTPTVDLFPIVSP